MHTTKGKHCCTSLVIMVQRTHHCYTVNGMPFVNFYQNQDLRETQKNFSFDKTYFTLKIPLKMRLIKGKGKGHTRTAVQLCSTFNLGSRCEWVVNATPRLLYPRERSGNNCIGGWVGPRVGLDGYVQSRPPTGIRSPDRPARSESLYRLSYPGSTEKEVDGLPF